MEHIIVRSKLHWINNSSVVQMVYEDDLLCWIVYNHNYMMEGERIDYEY